MIVSDTAVIQLLIDNKATTRPPKFSFTTFYTRHLYIDRLYIWNSSLEHQDSNLFLPNWPIIALQSANVPSASVSINLICGSSLHMSSCFQTLFNYERMIIYTYLVLTVCSQLEVLKDWCRPLNDWWLHTKSNVEYDEVFDLLNIFLDYYGPFSLDDYQR